MWHGEIPGWPALRHIDIGGMTVPWDKSTTYAPQYSKVRVVANAIDDAAGIPRPLASTTRLTLQQQAAAFAVCSKIERNPATNSFTSYYKSLAGEKKTAAEAATSGTKRLRSSEASHCS
jgi:hypothetical protein